MPDLEKIKKEVMKELEYNQKTKNVNIIYVCCCGSQIYGYANEDSDYDIYFVYKKSLEEYISCFSSKKNTITFNSADGKYQFMSYDIKKWLFLHYKSNPSVFEMTHSTMILQDYPDFKSLPDFNLTPLYPHYMGMFHSNYKRVKNRESYKLPKKYLNVYRSMLFCFYIEKFHGLDELNMNVIHGKLYEFMKECGFDISEELHKHLMDREPCADEVMYIFSLFDKFWDYSLPDSFEYVKHDSIVYDDFLRRILFDE